MDDASIELKKIADAADVWIQNGNAAGESNVEWAAGAAENVGSHGYNDFYQSGGTTNLAGLTANSTEITTDPLFVNAAGGDFRLKAGSPARSAAFPGQFLGGGSSVGYLDMGAVQVREGSPILVNSPGLVS